MKRDSRRHDGLCAGLVVFAALATFVGCKGEPAADPGVPGVEAQALGVEAEPEEEMGAATSGEVEERKHYYSPYYLTLTGGDFVFRTVTFQDVGMKQPEPGPMAPEVFEAIAHSLAEKFTEHEKLSFSSQVFVDRGLEDPNNHLFCESEHLYVALWRGYSPDRWGYSLWSGCAEEHQFAWEEVLDPVGVDKDLLGSVEYLTESIAESVSKASESKCFLANC
ncbi:hypothetical protein FRC96_18060 [Lujinxingia vulgaris]|uniref:Uncharacterized protein n=1 Tax=Lujinxingia vulgaris TaxID=2600176 RepID=A0A5C6WZ05_9DELT|nr:hypothetical protein [Lujinxingia vulgaris]TXD32319.1 hypothetical protein FRC96_18060 [Lujinxingia vulgaris]